MRHSRAGLVRGVGGRRRPGFTGEFASPTEPLESRLLLSADVLTYHNDNLRTGEDLTETVLTPANVNVGDFGKVGQLPVDGAVYAQPLYMAGVTIPGQGTHNVLFVATEHDSVYAFDADTDALLWHVSFLNPGAGITTVPSVAPYQQDIAPEVGITSTPVIDPSTGTLYVIAKTQQATATGIQYAFTLHALDVGTGAEKFGGPVVISATVRGTGTGNIHGKVSFQAQWELQRPALLLSNGVVYAAFGSVGDTGPYHGWILAYNARTLQQVAVFNDTPNSNDPTGNLGGIWMTGDGLSTDGTGNIYLLTGSGAFNTSVKSYADSALKLTPTLKVADYFTPPNPAALDKADKDLGSGGAILVPKQPGPVPDVLIGGGKDGNLYVVNRDAMGHASKGTKSSSVQTVPLGHAIFSTPAYFNGMVYIHPVGGNLLQYKLVNGNLVPVAASTTTFSYPGANPTISANGASNGIVWEVQDVGSGKFLSSEVLHAYNAANVSQELYNSNQDAARDAAGGPVKFVVPTIANGKVYVGGNGSVAVYGLLPPAS
jgi:hypothetical protein